MRDAVDGLDGDPRLINPLSPVDLVIDHSVMVDHSGDEAAFDELINASAQNPSLVTTAAELRRQSGDADGAVELDPFLANVPRRIAHPILGG